MKNAILIAQEFQSMLPVFQNPMYTEKYEGFFHLDSIQGNVEEVTADYIIRDHDMDLFEEKKQVFARTAEFLNQKYDDGTVVVERADSYYNMREVIEPRMDIIRRAEAAYRAVGVTPFEKPIRGGTDGSKLSFMGLPCPNLATGGMNYHGRFECIAVQDMDKMAEMLVQLLTLKA